MKSKSNLGKRTHVENSSGPRSNRGRSVLIPTSREGFKKFVSEFENELSKLSFYKLDKLSKMITRAKKRFRNGDICLSRNINRTFSEEELRKFFAALPDERYRLIFIVQLVLALRIGEICRLKIDQIDFSRQTILIWEEKTQNMIEKHVPAEIWDRLIAFMIRNKEAIHSSGHVWNHSKDWLRNLFRKTLKKAGLDRVYATSKTGAKLYVLSTHSFRRTGITKMAKALNGDPFRLKLYSGHKTTSSLEKYIQLENKGEIDNISDAVFSSKARVNELKRYFEK